MISAPGTRANRGMQALVLVMLLAGCTQQRQIAPDGASMLAAVGEEVGGYHFNNVHSEQAVQNYRIESGTLAAPLTGKVEGSLVMVADKEGAITAVIDRPGRRGTLHVDNAGKRRFMQEPPYDYLKPDAVEGREQPMRSQAAVKPAGTDEIDVLMLFSAKALEVLDGDPLGFALAQLETANLGLRNSQIAGVHLRLAGLRVTETDYSVDGSGLEAVTPLMDKLRPVYWHDVNVGYFAHGGYAGMAWVPGSTSVNAIQYPLAFRHEVAHNAGGSHCYPATGDHHRYGFSAGEGLATHLCGNQIPYYSNPDIQVDGKAIGDAQTANMARVWREQASRLSGYSPESDGGRMFMVGISAQQDIETGRPGISVGVVALSDAVGPTNVTYGLNEEYSMLRVPLQAEDGTTHTVQLRASRHMAGALCQRWVAMNSADICGRSSAMVFRLQENVSDNSGLPRGWYNGVVELQARAYEGAGIWNWPFLVSISIFKP